MAFENKKPPKSNDFRGFYFWFQLYILETILMNYFTISFLETLKSLELIVTTYIPDANS